MNDTQRQGPCFRLRTITGDAGAMLLCESACSLRTVKAGRSQFGTYGARQRFFRPPIVHDFKRKPSQRRQSPQILLFRSHREDILEIMPTAVESEIHGPVVVAVQISIVAVPAEFSTPVDDVKDAVAG